MTYRPPEDTAGAEDGHPGSLISIGHPGQGMVSEFDIPRPVVPVSRDLHELPVARTLQPFIDVTGGRHTHKLTGTALIDVELLANRAREGRLVWVMYEFYLPPPALPTLGWCKSTRPIAGCYGIWRIGGFPSAATSRYLFEIPEDWSKRHVSGKRLAAGRSRVARGGSWGPSLYAVEEEDLDASPSDGAATRATQLLKYTERATLRDYSNADDWSDGAWITSGSRSAVVIAGTKAERSRKSRLQYYGKARPYGCGSKGQHGEPYYGALLFYDVNELAAAAASWARRSTPQPYVVFQIENRLVRAGCRRFKIGGIAFDRARGFLYLMERRVDGRKPIVHAWRVTDSGAGPDETPPTTPGSMRAVRDSRGQLELVWEPSREDVGGLIYVVYRDETPIGITTSTRFWLLPTPQSQRHRYSVEARDSVNNRSGQSAPVEIEDPAVP